MIISNYSNEGSVFSVKKPWLYTGKVILEPKSGRDEVHLLIDAPQPLHAHFDAFRNPAVEDLNDPNCDMSRTWYVPGETPVYFDIPYAKVTAGFTGTLDGYLSQRRIKPLFVGVVLPGIADMIRRDVKESELRLKISVDVGGGRAPTSTTRAARGTKKTPQRRARGFRGADSIS